MQTNPPRITSLTKPAILKIEQSNLQLFCTVLRSCHGPTESHPPKTPALLVSLLLRFSRQRRENTTQHETRRHASTRPTRPGFEGPDLGAESASPNAAEDSCRRGVLNGRTRLGRTREVQFLQEALKVMHGNRRLSTL